MERALAVRRFDDRIRRAIDTQRPGLIDRLSGSGYRQPSLPEKKAVEMALETLRADETGVSLEKKLLGSATKEEAASAAILLIEFDRVYAANALKAALGDDQSHVRAAAAEGMSELALSADSLKERNGFLDAIAKAANQGIAEAADQIEHSLTGYFYISEKGVSTITKPAFRALLFMADASPIIAITCLTSSAFFTMFGGAVIAGVLAGVGICAVAFAKKTRMI